MVLVTDVPMFAPMYYWNRLLHGHHSGANHVKNLRSLRHLFPRSDKSTTFQTTRATLFFTLEPKRKWRVRNFLKK